MTKRNDLREWARDNMVGVENTTLPSFTADLAHLDEEGIRHDVRQAIAHGFFSTLVPTETGLSLAEAKQFLSIVCDEAKDAIHVTTTLLLDSWDQQFEILEHATAVGVRAVLLGYPAAWYPSSPQEIFDRSRQVCESTTAGVVLYPSPHYNFGRFHPSGFPLDVLARLVETCDNVVAAKVGDMAMVTTCMRMFGNDILVGCPIERFQPTCVLDLGLQWMGAGCYEVFQSPEQRYLVDYFDLLVQARREHDARKAARAMEIYWRLSPVRATFESQFNPMLGTYHWTQQKFYQWCVGGNGGVTRQPSMKLHQHEMEATRMAFRMAGIQPQMNDAEFFSGKAAYRRALADGPGPDRADRS